MAWQRFQYICRRAAVCLARGDTLSAALETARTDRGAGLYGPQIEDDALPNQLLDGMAGLDRHQAASVLQLYADLDVAGMALQTRVGPAGMTYLLFVLAMFSVALYVYLFHVAPAFAAMYADAELPAAAAFFLDYAPLLYLLLLVLAACLLLAMRELRRLLSWRRPTALATVLLLPSVRTAWCHLVTTLCYPLSRLGGISTAPPPALLLHLQDLERFKLPLMPELSVLAQVQVMRLQRAGQWQVSLMLALFGGLLMLMVCGFLVSAYMPLFMLGELS
jgi:hypothetical protein